MKIKLAIIIAVLCVFSGCKMQSTPSEYFDITTLNTNLFFNFGSRYFKDLQQRKLTDLYVVEDGKSKQGAASYEQYVKTSAIYQLDNAIAKIKDLKETDETRPMIAASLDLFNFIKNKFDIDYIKIAKLMDAKATHQEIDQSIAELEAAANPVIDEKYKKLMDIALPYAKKHDIQVKNF